MQIQDNFGSIIFIIIYLTLIWLGLIFLLLKRMKTKTQLPSYWSWIFLSYFLLGFGDLFHLGFRIYIFFKGYGPDDNVTNLLFAIGYIVTGITMTYFYIALLHAWKIIYAKKYSTAQTIKHAFAMSYIFFIIRIILIALPWNSWYNGTPLVIYGLSFRVISSLPLYVIGYYPIAYLYKSSKQDMNTTAPTTSLSLNKANHHASIWFIVSYACYTLTILFSIHQPLFGLFMIPKTIAYMIAFYYHFQVLNRDLEEIPAQHPSLSPQRPSVPST